MVLLKGHVLNCLKVLEDNSVDMIITSPPYWRMRIYPNDANVKWEDGWYGQLGLEPNLDMYINHLLLITKELKRVLKKTGVMFWNHGDNYTDKKSLALQNYKLAIKMVEEQKWILRNIIIWNKVNPLPTSAKDRLRNLYEPIFMFVKSRKYYFNLDAVRKPYKENTIKRLVSFLRSKNKIFSEPPGGQSKVDVLKNMLSFNYRVREAKKGYFGKLGVRATEEEIKKYEDNVENIDINELLKRGANPGDILHIPTGMSEDITKGVHFAIFPSELVEFFIKCGCPENGTVLDPFLGSGTTMRVCIEQRRNCIGIEIVNEYINLIKKRVNWGTGFIEWRYEEH